jgi:hypothetical protein
VNGLLGFFSLFGDLLAFGLIFLGLFLRSFFGLLFGDLLLFLVNLLFLFFDALVKLLDRVRFLHFVVEFSHGLFDSSGGSALGSGFADLIHGLLNGILNLLLGVRLDLLHGGLGGLHELEFLFSALLFNVLSLLLLSSEIEGMLSLQFLDLVVGLENGFVGLNFSLLSGNLLIA